MDLAELEKTMLSGATLEEIAEKITWQEFEDLCLSILEENGFHTGKHFRFKDKEGKRHEIDILATKPLVKKHGKGAARTTKHMAIDCKHWGCGRTSALKTAAEKQKERVKALKQLPEFKRKKTIPAILTLFQENIIKRDDAWIVPVFRLNAFLNSGNV
jgi:hypothetical protein